MAYLMMHCSGMCPREFWDTAYMLWVRHGFIMVKLLLDLHGQDLFKILINFIF